jgi:hypothetical protein
VAGERAPNAMVRARRGVRGPGLVTTDRPTEQLSRAAEALVSGARRGCGVARAHYSGPRTSELPPSALARPQGAVALRRRVRRPPAVVRCDDSRNARRCEACLSTECAERVGATGPSTPAGRVEDCRACSTASPEV